MLSLVSKQAEYAFVALVDLASQPTGEAIRAPDIAQRHRLPGPALEQVMVRLRRHGLLRSSRGPTGGYALARPANEITLLEVVQAVQQVPAGDAVRDRTTGPQVAVAEWIGSFERGVLDRLRGVTVANLLERSAAADMAQAVMPGL
jgi:Rrf2 family transcriptional regulator, iron-sulfur cluster assembly transcription factor